MENQRGSGLLAFLGGMAAGALLGVLLAPRSGKETRERLTKRFDDARDDVGDLIDDTKKEWAKARGKAADAAHMTKEEVEDLIRFMFEDMAGTFIAMARAEGSRVRLVVSRKAGSFIAKAIMAFTAVLFSLVIVLFLFLAWGLWLGQLLGNAALGMLAAGASFLVVLLLFYLLWRWVLRDRIILSVVNAVNDNG